MPSGLLTAYGEQLPRLQAEEQLQLVKAMVAASGNMRKPDLDRYLRSLQRTARGRRSEGRPKARPANAQALASMKITKEGG